MSAMDNLMLVAGKIGSQRHLAAVRDSFAATMPVIIAGSLVTVVNQIPAIINGISGAEGDAAVKWPSWLSTINGNVWWGSIGMITILLVISLAYNLAKSYNGDGLAASLIAFSTYMSIVPQVAAENWGLIHYRFTNATCLLVGVFLTIIVVELYVRLSRNEKLKIKMPDGVPPAVARSFSSLIPGIISIISVVALMYFFEAILKTSIFDFIVNNITAPLQQVGDSLPSALVIALLQHFLWILGLHGSNILEAIMQSVYLPLVLANGEAVADGLEPVYTVTKQFFDCFVNIGGSGATLGLIISIFAVAKAKSLRTIAKLGIAPGIFEINEPVIFGLPIVLNPILAIPFVVSPLVLTTISYIAVSSGLVSKTVAVTPWAMPPFLSGFIATGGDWRAIILTAINLAVSIAIYLPFVFVMNKEELKKEAAAN